MSSSVTLPGLLPIEINVPQGLLLQPLPTPNLSQLPVWSHPNHPQTSSSTLCKGMAWHPGLHRVGQEVTVDFQAFLAFGGWEWRMCKSPQNEDQAGLTGRKYLVASPDGTGTGTTTYYPYKASHLQASELISTYQAPPLSLWSCLASHSSLLYIIILWLYKQSLLLQSEDSGHQEVSLKSSLCFQQRLDGPSHALSVSALSFFKCLRRLGKKGGRGRKSSDQMAGQ